MVHLMASALEDTKDEQSWALVKEGERELRSCHSLRQARPQPRHPLKEPQAACRQDMSA